VGVGIYQTGHEQVTRKVGFPAPAEFISKLTGRADCRYAVTIDCNGPRTKPAHPGVACNKPVGVEKQPIDNSRSGKGSSGKRFFFLLPAPSFLLPFF